jgi:pimeloyl-ACP methyl ester carboxylesterase
MPAVSLAVKRRMQAHFSRLFDLPNRVGRGHVCTLVVGGEHTTRYFALINEVAVRCIPGSRLLIIPQVTHLMSSQNPAAFNEALLQFLAQH